jgi:hypothetical protein
MKNFLLLTFAVFLSISAFGQPFNKKTPIGFSQNRQNFVEFQVPSANSEKLDSTITDKWDVPSSQWIFQSRKKYVYTVNGYMTTCISSIRDETTAFIWVNSDKEETTVNTNGNTTLYKTYDWDVPSSQWVPSMKMEFTFIAADRMSSNSTYMWNTSTSKWDGLAKTEYTYDGSGNLISDIGYTWDDGTSAWVKDNKSEYTYSNGNVSVEINYNWDGAQWIKFSKTEFTYNANKKNSLDITFLWDGSQWLNSKKSEYTYDTGGNQTLSISYTWDGSQWVNSSKIESTYVSGKITVYSYFAWIGNQWFGMLKNEFTYGVSHGLNYTVTIGSGWVVNQWVKKSRATSWYSAQTSGINNFSEKTIHVYPNPAKEFIVFDLADISGSAIAEIFDIHGKMVLEQRLSDNRQISVSNLSRGLYIYKVLNGVNNYTGKLIIE